MSGSAGATVGTGTGPSTRTTDGVDLPDGCGDGVPTPGQYDCFVPMPMPKLGQSLGPVFGLDLDGDGREEMLTVYQPHQGGALLAPIWFEGTGFRVGVAQPFVAGSAATLRYDSDGDGLVDLIASYRDSSSGSVTIYPSRLDGLAEKQRLELTPSGGGWGRPFPVDPDEDGELSYLLTTKYPLDFGLYQFDRQGDGWAQGEPLSASLPACGAPDQAVYGDFDEDGHLDVFMYETPSACDPYPSSYDPSWHRGIMVLANATTGALEVSGTYPLGGVPRLNPLVDDFDGDGHLDVLLNAYDGTGIQVLAGVGNGTLEAPASPQTLSDSFPGTQYAYAHAVGRGDLDGDGAPDLVIDGSTAPNGAVTDGGWIVPIPFSKGAVVHPFEQGWGYLADTNGDGVDDWVREDRENPEDFYLMVSVP